MTVKRGHYRIECSCGHEDIGTVEGDLSQPLNPTEWFYCAECRDITLGGKTSR